jgi:hypothetical protein
VAVTPITLLLITLKYGGMLLRTDMKELQIQISQLEGEYYKEFQTCLQAEA